MQQPGQAASTNVLTHSCIENVGTLFTNATHLRKLGCDVLHTNFMLMSAIMDGSGTHHRGVKDIQQVNWQDSHQIHNKPSEEVVPPNGAPVTHDLA